MRIGSETKIFIGIFIATMAIIGIGLAIFSKPEPVLGRADLIPQDSVSVGPKNAKVYLVEFSDFQCPSCKLLKPSVDELRSTYKDKLLFVYRHFPLSQHRYAQKAAFAAEAAEGQGKFWQMYDFLFANQEQLSDDKITEGAKQLSLDMEKFAKDLSSDTIKNKIARDVSDGEKFGIDGTPTFFLNGKKLDIISSSDLVNEVQAAISKN